VRVLLAEARGRELPFVQELVGGFADTVSSAHNEWEVSTSLSEGQVDLAILSRDAWAPNDTELCRHLSEAAPGLPLLALSGPCALAERAAALRAGADEFLNIPFATEELAIRAIALTRRARVKELIVRASALVHGEGEHPRYVREGAFLVDFGRRQVYVEGRHVLLTWREYGVVATLVSRTGEVVNRRELAGQLDSTTSSGSNMVDVHVSRIREKLGSHAAAIETVRGIGYRFRKS
jgi:two-component system, OmpR family, response regulator